MKRLILTVLAAGMTTISFCQKSFILSHQDKKGFFSVSGGASLPVGRFGNSSGADNRASMTGQGLAYSVSAGYRLLGRVGLMVRGEEHTNAVRANALLNEFYNSDTDVWAAQSDNWQVRSVMAGPFVNIPMGRFSVDVRLLAGRAMATMPGTVLSGNFGEIAMGVETTGGQSLATAMGGGASLRYRLGRIFSAHLTADYTHAQFQFSGLTSTVYSSANRAQVVMFSSNRPMSVINVSAGISILFGNSNRPF